MKEKIECQAVIIPNMEFGFFGKQAYTLKKMKLQWNFHTDTVRRI